MSEEWILFLDFDDTVSNSKKHAQQYVSELSYLLSRDFGEAPEDWSPFIGQELSRLMERYTQVWTAKPVSGFKDWVERERVVAANAVFFQMGKEYSSDENLPFSEYLSQIQFDALTGTNALFEGVYESLQQIHERGVRIHMASSQESEYLRASVLGAGLDAFVERMFGPDLVDCPKEGTEYYKRIFDTCEIPANRAIVIDDQPHCLDWAEEVGARVIQSTLIDAAIAPEFPVALSNWSDLPLLLNPYLR